MLLKLMDSWQSVDIEYRKKKHIMAQSGRRDLSAFVCSVFQSIKTGLFFTHIDITFTARQNANYYMLYIHTQGNFVIEAKTVAIALSIHAKGHPIFLAVFSKREDVLLSQTRGRTSVSNHSPRDCSKDDCTNVKAAHTCSAQHSNTHTNPFSLPLLHVSTPLCLQWCEEVGLHSCGGFNYH